MFRYILSQQRAKTTQVPPIFRFLISFTTTGIESSFYHSIYVYFVFLFSLCALIICIKMNVYSPGLKFKWFYYCASSYPPLLLVTGSCSFVIFFSCPNNLVQKNANKRKKKGVWKKQEEVYYYSFVIINILKIWINFCLQNCVKAKSKVLTRNSAHLILLWRN